MIFLLISCCSFILSPWIWGKPASFLCYWLHLCKIAVSVSQVPVIASMKKMPQMEEKQEEDESCLLDLPELVLECIFERLSPTGLCSMAGVCRLLRERCCSDHLWEKHMKLKWGRVIGDAAHREWLCHIRRLKLLNQTEQNGFSKVWPFSLIRPIIGSNRKARSSQPVDSIMAFYLSLEHGKFWFPGQVYNRENGHIGFMLSCYDAQLRYDFRTDEFQARYSPHGQRSTEENIQWDRLRTPPVDTPSHVLHASDCLHDLKPGDHIEIQWRRSRVFPCGWWYGVVGHLESCDKNVNYCHCNQNDIIILEFNQYNLRSRWRQTIINRKDHKEEGNQVDGFYGGIRKLYNKEEISKWISLRPTKVL